MRIRRVIITRNENFADIGALAKHPNVPKCWHLPRGYTLFEFYHPVFDRIYTNDQEAANAARLDDSVRLQTSAAVTEERKLLEPLYRGIGNPSNALTLLVPTKTVTYYFVGRGKGSIAWPQIGYSKDWEIARSIRVVGRVYSTVPETVEALIMVINEWAGALAGWGEIKELDGVSISGERFSTGALFNGSCGDAIMALLMLLTETRNLTSVEEVMFLEPDVSMFASSL